MEKFAVKLPNGIKREEKLKEVETIIGDKLDINSDRKNIIFFEDGSYTDNLSIYGLDNCDVYYLRGDRTISKKVEKLLKQWAEMEEPCCENWIEDDECCCNDCNCEKDSNKNKCCNNCNCENHSDNSDEKIEEFNLKIEKLLNSLFCKSFPSFFTNKTEEKKRFAEITLNNGDKKLLSNSDLKLLKDCFELSSKVKQTLPLNELGSLYCDDVKGEIIFSNVKTPITIDDINVAINLI